MMFLLGALNGCASYSSNPDNALFLIAKKQIESGGPRIINLEPVKEIEGCTPVIKHLS